MFKALLVNLLGAHILGKVEFWMSSLKNPLAGWVHTPGYRHMVETHYMITLDLDTPKARWVVVCSRRSSSNVLDHRAVCILIGTRFIGITVGDEEPEEEAMKQMFIPHWDRVRDQLDCTQHE